VPLFGHVAARIVSGPFRSNRHMHGKYLMILELPARQLMAILLRKSLSYRGLNCPWEKNLGYYAGEELIPLLDDENKRVDKPEIDIVTAGDGALARIYGRIDIDSSPALRDRASRAFATTSQPSEHRLSFSKCTWRRVRDNRTWS
jgi:hypothetical protein